MFACSSFFLLRFSSKVKVIFFNITVYYPFIFIIILLYFPLESYPSITASLISNLYFIAFCYKQNFLQDKYSISECNSDNRKIHFVKM